MTVDVLIKRLEKYPRDKKIEFESPINFDGLGTSLISDIEDTYYDEEDDVVRLVEADYEHPMEGNELKKCCHNCTHFEQYFNENDSLIQCCSRDRRNIENVNEETTCLYYYDELLNDEEEGEICE